MYNRVYYFNNNILMKKSTKEEKWDYCLVHVQTKVLSIPPGEYGRKAETQIIRRPTETSSEACCLIR